MGEPDIGPSAIVDDDDEAAALGVLERLGAGYADELSEAERLADREQVDNLGRLRCNRSQTRPDEVRQASGRRQRQAQEPDAVLRIDRSRLMCTDEQLPHEQRVAGTDGPEPLQACAGHDPAEVRRCQRIAVVTGQRLHIDPKRAAVLPKADDRVGRDVGSSDGYDQAARL